MKTKKGLFITFEGGEGSGKSTQIRLLQEYLLDQGHDVLLTREPGGSEGGEEIRALLLKGGTDRWDKVTEMLLFSASRRDHLVKKVLPALARGTIVLSDRFADSTTAYQCYGYGFDQHSYETTQKLYEMVAGPFKPDLTFILDIDPVLGLNRSKSRTGNDEQRFEEMQLQFHQNIRNAFLTIAKQDPNRCAVINAEHSIDEIHQSILAYVKSRNL